MKEPTKLELVVDVLNNAISREQVIQFTYFRTPGFVGALRTFSPYIVDDEFGTVIGWDHTKQELRRFALPKIAWPVETLPEEEYIPPAT